MTAHDYGDYTVGWISAIATEGTAASLFLDEVHPDLDSAPGDGNAYILGRIGKHNVAIAVLPDGEYGIASAATVANDMIRTFPNIRIGLMVGIGGGAPSKRHDIRLGDVVVSSPSAGASGVFQYDYGKAIQDRGFFNTRALNQPPTILRTAVTKLKISHEQQGHSLESSIQEALGSTKNRRTLEKYSRPDPDSDRLYISSYVHVDNDKECRHACSKSVSKQVRRPYRQEDERCVVHYGQIASANALLKDAKMRDVLASERDVLCFEMEAAGLVNTFPCIVIRGICDYADTHKNDRWQGFAAMTAAAYAKDLLSKIPPSSVEREVSIRKFLTPLQEDVRETRRDTKRLKSDVYEAKLKAWLSPPDPSIDLNEALRLRHYGTGLWFLQGQYLQEWQSRNRQHLWLQGPSGCGKTVLSGTIIEHLKEMDDRVILYFFFNFADATKLKADDLVRSLIYQLYNKQLEGRHVLDALMAEYQVNGEQPTTKRFFVCLTKMLQESNRYFIYLDAITDCADKPDLSMHMQQLLTDSNDVPVQLIVTGTHDESHLDIFRQIVGDENIISLDKSSINADIHSYIKSELHNREDLNKWEQTPSVYSQILQTLTKKADGSFRWTACQVMELQDCVQQEDIEKQLGSLPETLNATYARMLQNIPSVRKHRAHRLLSFLLLSKIPIRLDEAVDIVAVRCDYETPFDPNDRMPVATDVFRLCPGLISATKSGEGIALQLAHSSVQEYLSNGHDPDFDNAKAEELVALTCLTYLGSMGLTPASNFPLMLSGTDLWEKYARSAEGSAHVPDQYLKLLTKPPSTSWSLGNVLRTVERGCYRLSDGPVPPLYFATRYGLSKTARVLLESGADIHQTGPLGNFLQVAAAQGYDDLVQLLLASKANPDAQGGMFGCALQAAAFHGHSSIVSLLLDNEATVSLRTLPGPTFPLSPLDLVRKRLAWDLLDQSHDRTKNTSEHVYEDLDMNSIGVAFTALNHFADLNHLDSAHLKLKRLAVLPGLLLEGYREAANVPNSVYGIARRVDEQTQQIKLMDLFYARFVAGFGELASKVGRDALKLQDINQFIDIYNKHAEATQRFNLSFVDANRFLLEGDSSAYISKMEVCLRQLDESLEENSARLMDSPLPRSDNPAVLSGLKVAPIGMDYFAKLKTEMMERSVQPAEMRLLSSEAAYFISDLRVELQRRQELKGTVLRGSSALQSAAMQGHLDVVKVLLKHGADIHDPGDLGSALHYAVLGGNHDIVWLLLEKGGRYDDFGFYGSPLRAACALGHESAASLLLYYGADRIEADGKHAALHAARVTGRKGIIKMLLDDCAEFDIDIDFEEYGIHFDEYGDIQFNNGEAIEETKKGRKQGQKQKGRKKRKKRGW